MRKPSKNNLRDFIIVLRMVWLNLLLFGALLIAGAVILRQTGYSSGASFLSLLTQVFHMAHLERVAEPGDGMIPQLMTFIVPGLTVLVLGEGVLRVMGLYLRRSENREEWDLMVAKTFQDHVVLCGGGELGRSLYRRLIELDRQRQIVFVDLRPSILAEIGEINPNTCHLQLDMTAVSSLEHANCRAARLIIIASGDDAINLEAAFKAHDLNPQAEIWVRLYRMELTTLLELETKPNLHFFSPYDAAAGALMSRIVR